MTVKELVEKLSHYPDDLEVVVQYRNDDEDYFDYDYCLRFYETEGHLWL